jgi:hypothetical protein
VTSRCHPERAQRVEGSALIVDKCADPSTSLGMTERGSAL